MLPIIHYYLLHKHLMSDVHRAIKKKKDKKKKKKKGWKKWFKSFFSRQNNKL